MSSGSVHPPKGDAALREEVLATRRAEAVALFEANQRGRSRAGGVLAVAVLTIVAAGTVGLASHDADLAIPLPTALLLMMAELFQHYTDVTVIGAARRRLEIEINAQLDEPCLLYETMVADIRKHPPLVLSERVLQSAGGLVVLASIVLGAVATYSRQPMWVEVLYPICTGAALAVAGFCYAAMIRSGRVAAAALADLGQSAAKTAAR